MIYFTADPHFDRESVLTVSKRPFTDVSAMNAKILDGYARRVTADDDLYLIGDLAHKTTSAEDARRWFDQIPGRKHLICGNHDLAAARDLPWESVHDYLELHLDGMHIILFHYPMLSWNQARAGSLQLFGHVHANWAGSSRAVNVGVDFWDYAPCTLPEILSRAKTLPEHPHWHIIEPNDS